MNTVSLIYMTDIAAEQIAALIADTPLRLTPLRLTPLRLTPLRRICMSRRKQKRLNLLRAIEGGFGI